MFKPKRDDSNAKDDAALPKRDKAGAADRMKASRARDKGPDDFGDKEIGSGGARTTTDGRPVGEGHPNGYRNNR